VPSLYSKNNIALQRCLTKASLSALIALAAAVALACGGDGQPTATPSPAPSPTAAPVPTLAVPTSTPEPWTPTPEVQGSGSRDEGTVVSVGPEPTATPVPTVSARVDPADAQRLSQQAMQQLTTLTSARSPRESATQQEADAARYLFEQFTILGYAPALQEFTVDVLLTDPPVLDVPSLDVTSTGAYPLTLSAQGRATGVLADAGKAFEEDFEGVAVEGRIALIERGGLTFEEKVLRAEERGAIAAIIYNNDDGAFAGSLRSQAEIPVVSIPREVGLAIINLMANGDTEAAVSVMYEQRDSRNVIADKPASAGAPRGEDAVVVVLGGHFDTVPGVPGANDNGSGIATLLAIAEEIAGKSYPFTVRFIAFGSEELGLEGSQYYVDNLTEDELDQLLAMLNFDALGTSRVSGILAADELADVVMRIGGASGITVERHFELGGGASDHAPFFAEGIPFVFFLGDDFSRIHTIEDTLEFVRPELMGNAAALAIVLLDELAAR